MANANATNKIEVLAFGHALIEGERGARGGKPSKDSVWGFAMVRGTLVTFGGRRNGTLRFKAFPKNGMDKVLALHEVKKVGSDKGFAYTFIDDAAQRETLFPGLVDAISKGFMKATIAKKVNRLEFAEKLPKFKKPNPKKVFAFPTQASVAHAAAQAAKVARREARAAKKEVAAA
jgi:hypothetical protein